MKYIWRETVTQAHLSPRNVSKFMSIDMHVHTRVHKHKPKHDTMRILWSRGDLVLYLASLLHCGQWQGLHSISSNNYLLEKQ